MPNASRFVLAAALLPGVAAADPAPVPLPEVGAVYEATAPGVLSVGYDVDRPVTPPHGPSHHERVWVPTVPAAWLPSRSNPHGGYLDVPVGAIVECVGVRVTPEPWPIAAVSWYGREPAALAGVLISESYALERGHAPVLVDGARKVDRPAAFDAAAWDALAAAHPDLDLAAWVARPSPTP